LVFLVFCLCIPSQAVDPCGVNEVYYGNYSMIECIRVDTGARRLLLDIEVNNLPFPGGYVPWTALNGEIWYPGFVTFLDQGAVEINVATQSSFHTGPGPVPSNVYLDWIDILVNPTNKLIYASFDWPIGNQWVRQFFYYPNASNSTAVSFLM